MNYRTLGKDLTVSTIGLGCMGMTHAYGPPAPEAKMKQLLHRAIGLGYTFFDTAECYTGKRRDGSIAYNEELLGTALKPYRSKIVIATKFGVEHSPLGLKTDSRPETIRKSVEGSLKRLDTDYIDLYYQHRIDPKVPVEDVAGTLADLIAEGKVRYWGMSEADEEHIRKAHTVCPLTAVQNRYSMMYRDYDSLFPTLQELNIGYVAFSPLANGILSDRYNRWSKFELNTDYRSFMPQYKAKAYEENKDLFALLRGLAQEKNATPAQISLAWMIAKHPNLVPIPGTTKSDRLAENAGAAEIILTAQDVAEIEESLDNMKMSAVFGGSKITK